MTYSTKGWVIGILIGAWIATFIVGFLHYAEIFPEPTNQIIHIFKDWLFVIIPLLPISYFIARIIKK